MRNLYHYQRSKALYVPRAKPKSRQWALTDGFWEIIEVDDIKRATGANETTLYRKEDKQ